MRSTFGFAGAGGAPLLLLPERGVFPLAGLDDGGCLGAAEVGAAEGECLPPATVGAALSWTEDEDVFAGSVAEVGRAKTATGPFCDLPEADGMERS